MKSSHPRNDQIFSLFAQCHFWRSQVKSSHPRKCCNVRSGGSGLVVVQVRSRRPKLSIRETHRQPAEWVLWQRILFTHNSRSDKMRLHDVTTMRLHLTTRLDYHDVTTMRLPRWVSLIWLLRWDYHGWTAPNHRGWQYNVRIRRTATKAASANPWIGHLAGLRAAFCVSCKPFWHT